MRGRQAVEEVAHRLELDLQTRFPKITIRVEEDEEELICIVRDDGIPWGNHRTTILVHDELQVSAVELALVSIAEDLADNLWPDELTDPWPPCPRHGMHPLQPRLVRGRASWACLRDDRVAVAIGALTCSA